MLEQLSFSSLGGSNKPAITLTFALRWSRKLHAFNINWLLK